VSVFERSVVDRVVEKMQRQAEWEAVFIPPPKLRRMAEAAITALGLEHVAWDNNEYMRPNPTQLWECWKTPWVLVGVEDQEER
jgi:hypothetical protein